MPGFTRRAFLVLTAALAPAARSRVLAQPKAATPFTSAEFLRLSERLLGRTGRDPKLAAIYRDALVAAPANVSLLARLALTPTGARSEDERALERTIVEWWYTGVYVRDGQPQLATHAGALMWSALGIPAAGSCAGAFGAWSRRPGR